MATINILTPPLHPQKFSGGIWCIFEYAHGLFARGHSINIVPILPSKTPLWYTKPYGNFISPTQPKLLAETARNIAHTCQAGFKHICQKRDRRNFVSQIHKMTDQLLLLAPSTLSHSMRRAASLQHTRKIIPPADITIATSFETALPAKAFGSGATFYFMQHDESLFCKDFTDPVLASFDAIESYRLGLKMIANSSWLKNRIEQATGITDIALCVNAIDQDVFYPKTRKPTAPNELIVISYGGRCVPWKGFTDMATAMQIARNALCGINLRWWVFGSAELPPNNSIATYEPLGFLPQDRLADYYSSADIVLSASWYESFPLFPLEGMASGTPVITTAAGTEDYAIHEWNAEIPQTRDIESIARSIIKLATQSAYRTKLAENGFTTSKKFTWNRSCDTMQSILLKN